MKRGSFFARFGALLAAPLAIALPAVETAVVDDDAPFASYGGGWRVIWSQPGMPSWIAGFVPKLTARTLASLERQPWAVRVEALDAGGAVREIFDVSRGIYAR
jgi:hypothetical protein